jgi:hypothetical protein
MWYSAVIVPASCAKDSSWPTYWDLGSKRAKKYSGVCLCDTSMRPVIYRVLAPAPGAESRESDKNCGRGRGGLLSLLRYLLNPPGVWAPHRCLQPWDKRLLLRNTTRPRALSVALCCLLYKICCASRVSVVALVLVLPSFLQITCLHEYFDQQDMVANEQGGKGRRTADTRGPKIRAHGGALTQQ